MGKVSFLKIIDSYWLIEQNEEENIYYKNSFGITKRGRKRNTKSNMLK
jgi:hypothetical protein